MLQYFSPQGLVKSTLYGCLILSSSLIPVQANVANPQILATPQAESIAQQVLKRSIAKEELDNTAKVVKVESIGKGDSWMYPAPPNWEITLLHPHQSWVLQGETVEDIQLIARNNPAIESSLPTQVRNEIKRIASKHLQIPPSVVLINNIEAQNFPDSCLGLGNLAELCAQQIIRGYRVTVTGKSQAKQIYRISNDALNLRTEAIAGLPNRTDELPTAIARLVFKTAQSDLQKPIANLFITQVEPRLNCFRIPTAPPNTPCLPAKKLEGWNVTVTNFHKSLTYKIDLNGKILTKLPSLTR